MAFASTSPTAIFAPRRPRAKASERPTPLAPPVMTATLLLKSFMALRDLSLVLGSDIKLPHPLAEGHQRLVGLAKHRAALVYLVRPDRVVVGQAIDDALHHLVADLVLDL